MDGCRYMSKIDYSKWDHFGESDESDEDNSRKAVQVTRLDKPSRIVAQDGQYYAVESAANCQSTSSLADPPATRIPTNEVPESWTDRGGTCFVSTLNHNEEEGAPLYWTQDRYTVMLRLQLIPISKKRKLNVIVVGSLSYQDRSTATVANNSPELVVEDITAEKICLWKTTLPHPVHRTEDDEDESVDWSIEAHGDGKRFLTIVLNKAVPMPGMFLWWKRPTMDCPETYQHTGDGNAFSKAWKEAHEEFSAKTRNRRKIELD